MRTSKVKVNKYLSNELYKMLHRVVADLKTPEEVEKFLQAFLSDAEHETLAKRVAVAYWLDRGRSYENIHKNLKVSSATIAVTQSALNNEGVKLALRKIKAEEWANIWSEKIQKLMKK